MLPDAARRWLLRERPGTDGTITLDGFDLMLDAAFPSPAPRFGWSAPSALGRALDARPGERVLVLDAASGLPGLHAARRGADVTCVDRRPEAQRCIRRNFLMAGFGDPTISDEPPPGPWDVVLGLPDGAVPELARGGRLMIAGAHARAAGDALTALGLRWSIAARSRSGGAVYRAWTPPEGEPPGEVSGGAPLPGAAWVLRDR